MMKLLGSAASPYTRKARLVLLEKGIDHDYEIDFPRNEGSPSARFNPLARIPVLILDDGSCLFDSPVIAEYADSLNDTPILIPRHDPLLRAQVKCGEALADGIMDAAVALRLDSLRPEERQDHEAAARNRAAVARSLAFAVEMLGKNKSFLCWDRLSLADYALVSALIYLDLRMAELGWRESYPTLNTWFEQIHSRPAVQASL